MKKAIIAIILVHLLQTGWPQPSGRRGPGGREGMVPPQAIHLRPFPVVVNDSEYKVYLLTDVMYDVMQFTLENDLYQAEFQTEITFKEEKSNQVFSRIWNSICQLPNFEITNRRDRFFLTYDSLLLPPGKYQVTLRYQDLKGKQKSTLSLNFHLPERRDIFVASPLFLESEGLKNLPILGQIPKPLATFSKVPFNRDIQIFFQAYLRDGSEAKTRITIAPKDGKTELFSLDTLLQINNNQTHLIINPPFLEWVEGGYSINLFIQNDDDSVQQQTPFDIIWFSKPRSLTLPEYAIQTLELILPEEDYKKLNSGNKSERFEKLMNFWKQRDPTPETAFNELMYEFYTRVDSVDRLYGMRNRTYGWKTDPGRIIILYGEPNEIDDQSLNPVKPYLKWTYVLPDKELTFVFEAVEGRKKYRLIQEEENPLP
ncbi:MAG: GWxTD domain-containing protein [bacterium]|nr:MAG: GWxTD domain-containing protein [bacterium]